MKLESLTFFFIDANLMVTNRLYGYGSQTGGVHHTVPYEHRGAHR